MAFATSNQEAVSLGVKIRLGEGKLPNLCSLLIMAGKVDCTVSKVYTNRISALPCFVFSKARFWVLFTKLTSYINYYKFLNNVISSFYSINYWVDNVVFSPSSPFIPTSTFAIPKKVEPGSIPHDNLPTIYLGDKFCNCVAVLTYPKILDNSNCCPWFSSK